MLCSVLLNLGDMNAQLPQQGKFHSKWFKMSRCNYHCKIIYDFMVANDFIAADYINITE